MLGLEQARRNGANGFAVFVHDVDPASMMRSHILPGDSDRAVERNLEMSVGPIQAEGLWLIVQARIGLDASGIGLAQTRQERLVQYHGS